MGEPADYREPVIVMAVRELIRDLRDDMNKRLDTIDLKLDDRVTVGVFRALRSDLDATVARIVEAEKEIDVLQEAGRAEELAREVAATTLQVETERRRVEAEAVRKARAEALETPTRTWNIRGSKATVVWAILAVVSILYAIFHAYLKSKGL
jgi:predicted  nucleic acid-binding Zn-ribbon protein